MWPAGRTGRPAAGTLKVAGDRESPPSSLARGLNVLAGMSLEAIEVSEEPGAQPIERPRERMYTFGPAVLSNVELIALLLGGGKTEQRALALLQRVGGLGGLLRCVPQELAESPGIGEASATAVCAAVELARRLGQLQLPVDSAVRGSDDVRRFVHAHLRGRSQEVFMVLGLDSRQRIRLIKEVGLGSVAHVQVHPREVFRPLIQAGAHSVILVHNHPSGERHPSERDIGLTQRLVECGWMVGIPVLDHLIVTDAGSTSMLALGLIPSSAEAPFDPDP